MFASFYEIECNLGFSAQLHTSPEVTSIVNLVFHHVVRVFIS